MSTIIRSSNCSFIVLFDFEIQIYMCMTLFERHHITIRKVLNYLLVWHLKQLPQGYILLLHNALKMSCGYMHEIIMWLGGRLHQHFHMVNE